MHNLIHARDAPGGAMICIHSFGSLPLNAIWHTSKTTAYLPQKVLWSVSTAWLLSHMKNEACDFLIFSPQGYKSKIPLIPKAISAWLLPEKRESGTEPLKADMCSVSSWRVLCQSVVCRKSASVPVPSKQVGEPWKNFSREKWHHSKDMLLGRCESCIWWQEGSNMGLLLGLSILVFLETFKLCIISVTSSLIKVYALHVKFIYLFRFLT